MSDLSQPLGMPAADSLESLMTEWLEAMAVPAWLHREGLPLLANAPLRRLCGLAGLPPGKPLPAHMAMACEDDREALATATQACLHGQGEPPAQALRLLAADGGLRPVELTLRRVTCAGQAAALITCVDHSDFQHVQAMLQSMSSMLRQIVDGAPVASYVIDRHHRITHWNEACARLTGHAADEMLGTVEAWRAFYDKPHLLLADWVVDGIDPRTLDTHYGNTVRPSTLVPGAFESEVQIPDLAPGGVWLLVNTVPLRDHAGEITGAIVTLQDVTQSRRTEQELTRRLEQMLEERSAELAAHARVLDAFVDNAPMGVVYAADTTVLRSNRRMVEIFGAAGEASEAIQPSAATEGRTFFMAREDMGMLRQLALPHLSRGEPLHHEMWMRHASGRPVWVQVNAYAVDPGNKTTGVWWMLQDRTDVRAAQQELHQRFEQLQATNAKLEQAQNQLLQNDKMASIGQLAAGVAHEINNPVGFVSSNLSTLRQYVQSLLSLADAYADAQAAPGDADLAAQLATVIDEVELDYLKEDLPQLLDESADGLNRVKKIVQDLKDFSRVDQADWQQADLNAGLESTLNVVRNEVKYKAEVVKQLGTLPLVLCLAGQLNQVFMNLIVNASHAIADKGVITLSSGAVGDWVWVQVDDTGCGMSEDVQRRIFEPFYTTKDVGKGTGLGLSLSFSIVQRHGGAIRARSVVGQGSSFRVWVPVQGPGATGPAEPPAWD